MTLVLILIIIYLIQHALGIFLVGGYFKKDKRQFGQKINQVSVVIPFKNEANRINPLLLSLLELNIPDNFSLEFLFVDDHSSDQSGQIIQDYLKDKAIIMGNLGDGKKAAIRSGVQNAKYDFILTLDADVSIGQDYFQNLSLQCEVDLLILPVRLTGNKLIQKLGSIEFTWLQMLGIGLAKYQSPFLCNGANLLFSKKKFLELDSKRTDYDIRSGDDMFLLEAMRKADANISATSDVHLIAFSEGPENFRKLRLQRSRWINKMKGRSTLRDLIFAFFQVFFVGGMVIGLYFLKLEVLLLIPLLFKVLNEYLLLQFERRFISPLEDVMVVVLHQLWYLFYLVSMLVPINAKEERWG